MSSRFTATSGTIDRLEVKDIRVFKDSTPLIWSGRLKNRSINLLDRGATAKLSLFQSGNKGILSIDSYLIGTDDQSWSYDIKNGSIIQVGMATPSRSLSNLTPNSDHVAIQLAVSKNDKIVFYLSSYTLTIEHDEKTYSLDLTPFSGMKMHPWLSDVSGSKGFSVTIGQYRFIDISIDKNNIARIATVTTNKLSIPLSLDTGDKSVGLGNASFEVTGLKTQPGQDFSITSGTVGGGLTVSDADGFVEIDTILKVNSIDHRSAGSLIFKGSSTAVNSVQIDGTGNLIVTPGAVITNWVKAPDGSSINMVNSSGIGMHISNGGIVTFDNSPKLDNVQSNPGTDLTLTEGTSGLGVVIADNTGAVIITGASLNANVIDTATPGIMSLGTVNATQVNISRSGIDTVIRGNLNVLESLDVTGNITVTGTVDNIDIAANTTGSVTVHSDVTNSGSGQIITVAERNQISTNNTNATGSVNVHSDITNVGSGAIITATERTAIEINNTNATGSVTVHSDVTDAGSGVIITAVERIAIGTNTTKITGPITIHSDINITTPSNSDILSYDISSNEWVNKTITEAGFAAVVHTHVAADVVDFNSGVDAQVALQRGVVNGIASLDVGGKVPIDQLTISALNYTGTWNASTNSPTLASGAGTKGDVYIVSADGSTNLDGITDWKIHDWATYNGTSWEKVDNTDLVQSVAGKTGIVTLDTGDITDLTVGSGAIITVAERNQIGQNNTNATGSVTVHSDVTDAGSGAIITVAERLAIGTNTANITGSVTAHSDVTSAGSGAIITSSERLAITGGSTGTVTTHSDITDAGSGFIITVAERNQISTNNTNATGSVTVHSDVTNAGSGAIITTAERTAIGTNATKITGTVTIHSDITNAGSGAIITSIERTAIGANTISLAGKLNLAGGTMSGNLDLGSNEIINVTDQLVKGMLTLGVPEASPYSLTPVIVGTKTIITSTSGAVQYIVPVGSEFIVFKLWGGGGGGSRHSGGGGTATGGGGGFTEARFTAVAGDEFWIKIGQRGLHGGSGGNNGVDGGGGNSTGIGNFIGGGAGQYTSIHKLVGGNYTLIGAAGGGGGAGADKTTGYGGQGGGGNGDTGSNGGNGTTGNAGSNGIGGSGGNGEQDGADYGLLTQSALSTFNGRGGSTSTSGGGGGGGYGGGEAGLQSGGGGGGGGYFDPSSINTTLTMASSGPAANSGDIDYVGGSGIGGFGSGNGTAGSAVIASYYDIKEWHERKIKSESGNNIVLENFSGSSKITLGDEGGISIDGVITMSSTIESDDSITGSFVTSGGVGMAGNLTVGGVTRLEHQESAPSAPSTNDGYFYVRNSILYFMGDNGTEKTVTVV